MQEGMQGRMLPCNRRVDENEFCAVCQKKGKATMSFFFTTGVRQNSIVKACVEDLQTELYMQTCAKMCKVLACLVSVYFLVISIAQRWCTIRKSLHFESRRSQSPTGEVRPP